MSEVTITSLAVWRFYLDQENKIVTELIIFEICDLTNFHSLILKWNATFLWRNQSQEVYVQQTNGNDSLVWPHF